MVDFSRNKKQAEFFYAVMAAISGKSPFRYFAFGGGVRGGKTFAILGMLAFLAARLFPNSRWHIIRKNARILRDTTIPSMQKILPPNSSGWRYKLGSGNMHIEFANGSKIYFMGENIDRDKDLNNFLGLETNGIFLEQSEELAKRMLNRAIERTGSWYLDPMPPPLIFMSFNPTQEWPREKIYDPWTAGELEKPWMFIEALPNDNPFVTKEQWSNWQQMDEVDFKRMIEGDWDSLRTGGEIYYKYSRKRHTGQVDYIAGLPIHITFDQNVKPYITLNCWQVVYLPTGVIQLRQFDEYTLGHPHNTTEDICEAFMRDYGKIATKVFFYGDASGNRRSTSSKETDYQIAQRILRPVIAANSDRTMRRNPNVAKRCKFINNIFADKYPVQILIDADRCRETKKDYQNIKQDKNGNKLKQKAKDENGVEFEKYGHTSDANDYFIVRVLDTLWDKFLNA